MTLLDSSLKRIGALIGLLLGLGLSSSGRAAPTADGVVYTFQGTVASISGSLTTCCDLAFDVGDLVTGAMQLNTVGGGARVYAVFVDLPLGGVVATGSVGPFVLDGAPGSTDRIRAVGIWSNSGAIVNLQPGFILGSVGGGFDLIDLDGIAWSGVNPRTGDIPPDYAPALSVFETAEVFFDISTFGPGGIEQSGTIHIQLTALDVPEPTAALLALAALVAVASRRARVL